MTNISLIVCTRNRAESLTRCLAALAALESPSSPWELVLVDNGSTDRTPEVINSFGRQFPAPMRVAHESTPGLGRARNIGLRESRGVVVAFTDDDCYPAADFLTRILEEFDQTRDLGFLGGRILLHDETDAPITVLLRTDGFEIAPRSCLPPGMIQGANMAFRRTALEQVGGFDDGLGAGTPFACEDLDACALVNATGWRGRYVPSVVVRHHHGRKAGAAVRQLEWTYAKARGAYYVRRLLDARVRAAYARDLRWRTRYRMRQRQYRLILGELTGAVRYTVTRAVPSLFASRPRSFPALS
jgi:glycosyltransferase involved in cell wall biosynthesis